jgi:cellulose synthase/poly-beta-1,6-N-acetylglucosamine synthase-like glycosyltransferase
MTHLNNERSKELVPTAALADAQTMVIQHRIAPLPQYLSAERLLSRGQAVLMYLVFSGVAATLVVRVVTGFGPSLGWLAQMAVAGVTVVYCAVIGFKLAMVFGAGGATVIRFMPGDLRVIGDTDLPRYTILVPLHREAEVLPYLLARLGELDYPVDKLQILLLVEEDDTATRGALDEVTLREQFEVVLIPHSTPKTKPKACNVGLTRATGEFCVIYDAEDRPDPDQLRKAVLAFRLLPDRVVCVQAELHYWNPWTNWLTQCFAAEYATNFSLSLRGLDRHQLAIPLGGTSNHFRTDALRSLGGWDPFNVTEDADLGIRIARRGWDVRMMVSVTEEEANSRLGNWVRQRSRWIKGYIQTWLVHTRNPWRLWRELGTRRFVAFHLMMGFSTFTMLVNPIFWALTLTYLVTGPQYIEVLFPAAVLYLGVATMILGNVLMMYCLMLGCMERGLHRAVRIMLTVPLYWGLMSVAAYKALFQLLRPSRRHYWELTEHGLVAHEP